MKTIDELIKKFEICNELENLCSECPYIEERCSCDPDALHYLKTYQANKHAYEEGNRKAEEARERYLEAVKNCEVAENKYKRLCKETSQKFADTSQNDPDGDHQQLLKCQALLQDFYRNDPLTWDDLRQMEGKPVWVEEIGRKYSTPHWAIHHGIMDGYDGDENLYLEPFEVLTKFTLGKTWQAYRKERG